MLLNNFYEIISITEENLVQTFNIRLNSSHHIYEGHFTGHPIVPGVCTLQIIKDCAETIIHKKFVYAQISSAKFLSLVDPKENDLIEINISLKNTDNNQYSLIAEGKYQNTDTIFIKVKATLKEIDNE
ncbi:hydroxymyristoyl-ACP dehydratase [Dysgonomonas sp. Marseille-P4677]|nr:hydroxymyristoyl-ACP dehydratase [Dysgonomonas sp. Marseille-P4677]